MAKGGAEYPLSFFHRNVFYRCSTYRTVRNTLTLIRLFTLGRDGSFAVPAAAHCRPAGKTASAKAAGRSGWPRGAMSAFTRAAFATVAASQLSVNSGCAAAAKAFCG